ncbi:MAG: hypothetical protein FWG64_13920 [Firmicutes bacterium]|nr:hypothetical protein [Bacillota bacterium]
MNNVKIMENLWGIEFGSVILPYLPIAILRRYSYNLGNITDALVATDIETFPYPISGLLYDVYNTATYEFFIHSPFVRQRYRIMLFTQSEVGYPVTMLLSDNIAKELGFEKTIECHSEEDFSTKIHLITHSNYVHSLLEKMYTMAQDEEYYM